MGLRIGAFVLCLFVLLSAGFVAADTPSTAPSRYTIAIVPFYSPEKIWILYSPFIEHLKTATGLPWELKLYHNHNALVEDICNGQVAVSLLGPVPLGRVYAKCKAEPFLVALGRDGKPTYRSVIITGDHAVMDLNRIRGKKFGLFKGSTAAHILPLKMLKDAGLDAASFQEVFFESQDKIMTALLTRDIAAAGVKESLYLKFRREPLRELKTSDALPNFAFCAAPSLSAETRKLFSSTLLKLQPRTNPRDAETVKGWDDEIKNGFMPPAKEFLPAVLRLRQIYKEVMHED
ncbi:MAG: hypothetical protein C0402_13840 [Thermodesulfovibrio sp.]|nr:hypothetical protein [Thermodesulfovibrio sp.]